MAAFTEGFSNVSGGEGKASQHLGKVIGTVLEARQLASDERREAQKKLSEQAPHLSLEDFGIDKGYFFKKALQHSFGGEFIDQKKQSLKKLLSARRILKSKKKLYVTTRNFLRDSIKVDGGRAASFRKKFDYKLEVETPAGLEDSSKKVAKAASGGGGPRTKQDFLTAVTEIAKSLQSTAQSINNAVDQNTGIASGIVSTQKNIVVEISHRTDRVTDKLEAIAAAVNQQTEFLKRAKTTAKIDKKEAKSELKRAEASFTRGADLVGTEKDESMEMSTSETTVANRTRTTNETYPDPWMDMEKGGVIIDGPDTGYKASTPTGVPFTAHGKEWMGPAPGGGTQIVPIDNRATDGIAGNEVTPGGDLMAEKGMKIPPLPDFESLTPLTGLSKLNLNSFKNAAKTVPAATTTTSGSSAGGQDMIDAMELPFRAVGASLLKVTGDVRNRLGEVSPSADAKLNNISNVLASSFGLSAQDVAPTKASGEANARVRETLAKQEKVLEFSEKNVNWRQAVRNFIGNKWNQTGNLINSTKEGGKNLINNMLGRNKEFSQKEIATIFINEFKKQGLSDIGAQLATAEFMRESSLLQSNVLGSHMDGNERAWGAGSWQLDRDDALFKHLKEKYNITPESFASSGKDGIRGQASFMLEEMRNKELLTLLKKPSLNEEEKTRVRQLFKEAYFRYAESIPLDRSKGALEDIHKLLGIETSNLQSSTRDIFSSDNFLEEFKVASNGSATEIVNLNLGENGSLASSASFTDSLTSGDDTLGEGSEWPLEIATYYPQKLHG